jgi:hypothetical protein
LSASPDTTRYLHELHESYVEKVNLAVEEGREDLIPGLVDAYFDEALRHHRRGHDAVAPTARWRRRARTWERPALSGWWPTLPT